MACKYWLNFGCDLEYFLDITDMAYLPVSQQCVIYN